VQFSPTIKKYWVSYIKNLILLDHIEEARIVLNQVKNKGAQGEIFDKLEELVAFKSRDPSSEKLRALIDLHSQGKFQQILDQAASLLLEFPKSHTLLNIRGTASAALGRHEQAIEDYKNAIKINPDYTDALFNIGVIYNDRKKFDAAVDCFQQVIKIEPDYIDAYNNMGTTFVTMGKPDMALGIYLKALRIRPGSENIYYNIGILLKTVMFKKSHRDLLNTIDSLLIDKHYVRPKDIFSSVMSLLRLQPNLQKAIKQSRTDNSNSWLHDSISDLSEIPLLLTLMSICPLADLKLEALLKGIRFKLLMSLSELTETPQMFKFQSALALQCFVNEYIYSCSSEEKKALQALEICVKAKLLNSETISPAEILCLASYRALGEYEWCNIISVTTEIKEVFTRQVIEPKDEVQRKARIPCLEQITDDVSVKVREQYETNPYPRWVKCKLTLKPVLIAEFVDYSGLRLFDTLIREVETPEILIAGCGTGQNSIETGTTYKNSKVLAIDLSKSSLAYANRKTEELGLNNIEYMQGDILNINKLGRQFDIIESMGVLHHMDDPMAGWKVLVGCLKSGGLINIGLYSELARKNIVSIRREINDLGLSPCDKDMRFFRDLMTNSEASHHKSEQRSHDFYSLSAFRDLFFHEREHRFSLEQIEDCLLELGLKFCGFGSKRITDEFKRTNIGVGDAFDLQKWNIYERKNPNVFAGMYQFWCQKIP